MNIHAPVELFEHINWTEERVADLKRLFEAGLSCSQIGAEMGIKSRNAVIGKIHRLGFRRNKTVSIPKSPRPPRPPRASVQRRQPEPRFPPLSVIAQDEPAAPVDVCPNRISLLEATKGQCRWPAADDGGASMVCGNQTVDGHSWCLGHCRIAYEARSPRRQTNKPIPLPRILAAV